MLSLFCGGGLACWGYWQSGRFSEIVGVDIDSSMSNVYPFDFLCADALSLDYVFLSQFDFIHASPPCQYYSRVTPSANRKKHERLIPGTHLMLKSSGLPHVIENVPGSGHDLRPNLVLSGANFGLPMRRERLFHVSEKINSSLPINISSAINVNPHGRNYVSKNDLIRAFGLNEMPASHLQRLSIKHIEQGIPPSFTKWIASQIFGKLWIR